MVTSRVKKRWGFLAPWCAALKKKVVHFGAYTSGGAICLTAHFPSPASFKGDDEADRSEVQKWREALALMAALRRVDSNAWVNLMSKHCGMRLGRANELEGTSEIFIQLSIQIRGAPDFANALVHFCGVEQRTNPSYGYLQALKRIAARDKTLQNELTGVDIHIPVQVECFSVDQDVASLRKLVNVGKADRTVREQWKFYNQGATEETVARGSLRCTFRLEPMALNLIGACISSRLTGVLESLEADNVWISDMENLNLSLALEPERVSKKAFARALGCILHCAPFRQEVPELRYYCELRASNREKEVHRERDVQMLCPHSLQPHSFEAMCSALVHNQIAPTLSLGLPLRVDERARSWDCWRWIAYALFSKRARSCSILQSLCLSDISSMRRSDMEGVAAILESDHPEEELCRCPRGQVAERDATLEWGAEIRWEFGEQGQRNKGQPVLYSENLVAKARMQSVRTFSDDGKSEWVNVLIPGYGRCQVQRGDLDFSSPSHEESTRSTLESLRIIFDGDDGTIFDGLPVFLAAVGRSLKDLMLHIPPSDLNEVTDVDLANCPDLRSLTISGVFFEADFELNEYHATNEPLPVLGVNPNNILTLLADVSREDTPHAKTLRRLTLRLNEQNADWSIPEDIKETLRACLRVLRRNRLLEYLRVVAYSDHQKYTALFNKFHLQPTKRVVELSKECKLALISVFSAHSTPRDRMKLRKCDGLLTGALRHELNDDVLSRIFSFAVSPVLRQVLFEAEQVAPAPDSDVDHDANSEASSSGDEGESNESE